MNGCNNCEEIENEKRDIIDLINGLSKDYGYLHSFLLDLGLSCRTIKNIVFGGTDEQKKELIKQIKGQR